MRRLSELVLLTVWLLPAVGAAKPESLNIKVIHAHNRSTAVDPRIEKLVKQFKLAFTAYELKDEAEFSLELGSIGRMQLPGGEWMSVIAKELAADGKLKLELTVDKLKFKSTVSIDPGATLAVGGPAQQDGALLLAISRPKPN